MDLQSPSHLTIDAGNTRTKCALFEEDGQLLDTAVYGSDDIDPIHSWVKQHAPTHGIMATSGMRTWGVTDLHLPGLALELSHTTPLPIQILYSTPETLGRDRIAAACGAHALYPGQNCLIISAGTCVTSDILLGSGIYLGGNIAPGLRMRLQAMHHFTARLPLAEPQWPDLPFGDSTLHALQNGAALGIVMEIEGLWQRARDAFSTLSIVITGGDADVLAGKLNSPIFAEPELVNHGLFQILAFNVKLSY